MRGRLRERNCHVPHIKALLNQRRHQKCLTWVVEKKTWPVAHWSSVKLEANGDVYLEILVHFTPPSADKTYRDADFFFHLPSVPKPLPNNLLTVLLLWLIGQPSRPNWAPRRICGGIAKRKMRKKHPKNPEWLKAAIKEIWCFSNTSADPSPHCTEI